ncbi:hypothetical protein KM759_gp105 [Lymphocystis disease virus 4]|uniref:Uncharacterized protein n=1 Tax=Lymphocystis disease virus 4 TaxID=2704413 RepID=A0A6B9XMY8_9VIRU|nr:hypothetical protein KM759_gp105 [Lymphocystis disease virus 4]QHR78462.1 hypothetical protein [Lymphocystis disease virus 4]
MNYNKHLKMNFFYFCEQYAFKTNKIIIDAEKSKLFDFEWPKRSENYFDQAPAKSMAVVKSSVPGSDFTILIKSKTNKFISLELIVFYNEYRVFNAGKLVFKGQHINFVSTCTEAFNRIKRRYKCFLISPPKKVLVQRLSNNLELIYKTWFKFLEEAGSSYWGYINNSNFSNFPKNIAILYSSSWFYCEDVLEVCLSQSYNRLRIKMIKGVYSAQCQELKLNLWHAESPWPLINVFLKYHGSCLLSKPKDFVEDIPKLRLETVAKEIKPFLSDKFWGTVVTDDCNIENVFDREIWNDVEENACILYHTETEIPQYLFTIYAEFSKYRIVYNPTGFLLECVLFKTPSGNIIKPYDGRFRVSSLKFLDFNFIHRPVPSLQQLCRCLIDLKTLSPNLKIRYLNF